MIYNFVTNLSSCADAINSTLSGNSIGIIYYSHIPTAATVLFLGIFVFIKNKRSFLSTLLLILSISFAIWSVLDLYLWVSYNSQVIMTTWSLTGIFEALIYIMSFYFIYVFINKKDLPFYQKMIIGLLFLPIIIMTPTIYNVNGFDYLNCWAIDKSFYDYIYVLEIIMFIWLVFVSIRGVVKAKIEEKRKFILTSLGVILFLASFFTASFVSQYLTNLGVITGYGIEPYGLFGVVVFTAFLAYIIVKFKEFDIKLLGAQALVWALVILVGSQFFYLENQTTTVKVLTAITLVISSVLGLLLVRGVKREIALRESLQTANEGQVNLIHIMNHQIKGYLGKDENVFAELLDGDYGTIPDEARSLIQEGLEETNAGVNYVTEILRGASAENGTLPYDMKSMDLKELVTTVVRKRKSNGGKTGISI